MDPILLRLAEHLQQSPATGPIPASEFPRLLAWAKRLTGAPYGFLRAGSADFHDPDPLHTSVPATPWPGVSVTQRSALIFAAHTAGGPLVVPNFPPTENNATFIPGMPTPLEDFLRRGGGPELSFPSPGTFLVVPLAGFDRYSGMLLDGQGNLFGEDTCEKLADLVGLASVHGATWPDPDEILGSVSSGGGVPMLEWMGQRLRLTEPVTLGQDPAYTLSVSDGLTSRRHLMVVPLISGQAMVVDLKSSNGTLVNGERVEQKILEPGDVIHTAKRNWTLTFRRVANVIEEPARELVRNQTGFDSRTDGGGALVDAVRSWRGELTDRLPVSLALELVACQFGFEDLALITWEAGPLRFVGARAVPRPGPLGTWRRRATDLLRLVEEKRPVPVVENFGGVLPLANAHNVRAIFTHPEGKRVDTADLQRALSVIVSGGPTRPAMRLFDLKAREKHEAAARATTSGMACQKVLSAYAESGFPVEALQLGREISSRYLDGDELEAYLEELTTFDR